MISFIILAPWFIKTNLSSFSSPSLSLSNDISFSELSTSSNLIPKSLSVTAFKPDNAIPISEMTIAFLPSSSKPFASYKSIK